MERKLAIPKMSTEEIAKRYGNIKPIVKKQGIPKYLRKLSEDELTHTAYNWLNEPWDYTETVDYSKLAVLADVKMLHVWAYYGFFKPVVGEVIRQIPNEYLEKVVAFEIIRGAIGYNSIYKKELNAGFHVSIVRLYQSKDDTNEEAQPIGIYPTSDCKIPIGMTEKEFRKLKELYWQED